MNQKEISVVFSDGSEGPVFTAVPNEQKVAITIPGNDREGCTLKENMDDTLNADQTSHILTGQIQLQF